MLGQAKLAAFLQTQLQASLPMVFQKLRSIRFANDPAFSLDRSSLDCFGHSRDSHPMGYLR